MLRNVGKCVKLSWEPKQKSCLKVQGLLWDLSMDSLFLLTLIIVSMSSGGYCFSQSMSCSTVNGRTVCERQASDGNVAGAFAGAVSGQNGAFQDAAAMTGNTHSGQSQSSRTTVGRNPSGNSGDKNFHPNANPFWTAGSNDPPGVFNPFGTVKKMLNSFGVGDGFPFNIFGRR
ncbi:hypothetical protein HNY73_020013 [Argiope bruennichi]|uniref:Uncharacterized protein n=2 Tax=Argiope bruennichi TaxID=94029 RepID=A0A8T0E982_ARGBR|nr:hypothetical protein HNY73_020013 [Argiope bruennichi]